MSLIKLTESSKAASSALKAMANEKRLTILAILSEGEHSVGQLESMVDLSQSALSQHLARLRRDRLVQTRRDAQTIYYSLNGEVAGRIMQTLCDLFTDSPPAGRTSYFTPNGVSAVSA